MTEGMIQVLNGNNRVCKLVVIHINQERGTGQ